MWLLNRLTAAGFDALLFERDALGSRQTINSQGIIHGGVKYALGGVLTGGSEAIAEMPRYWKRCLLGEGEVDLSRVTILSEEFFLWSAPGLASNIKAFLAGKALRGRVETLTGEDRPPQFRDPRFKGRVYRLADFVLDVTSLLKVLAGHCPGRIRKIDWTRAGWELRDDGTIGALVLREPDRTYAVEARRFIFASGEGNEALLRAVGASGPAMQRRPLHQVLVKHDYPLPLYAHCLGASAHASPRLTISSHRAKDGRWVWYLGGDLATENIDTPSGRLIEKAAQELKETIGWLDLGRTEWDTFKIDRAEPRQKKLIKPDKAFAEHAHGVKNAVVVWPTKLAFAPALAEEVMKLLNNHNVRPGAPKHPALTLRVPDIAAPCWDMLF